eukprot:g1909.t1
MALRFTAQRAAAMSRRGFSSAASEQQTFFNRFVPVEVYPLVFAIGGAVLLCAGACTRYVVVCPDVSITKSSRSTLLRGEGNQEAIDSSLQSEDVLEVLVKAAKKKIIDARKVVDGRKMMDILRRSDQSACGTIAKESFVRCLNWLGVPELTKGELNAILLASGATQSTSDRVDYEHFVIFVFAGNDASRDVEVESSLTRSLKLSREKLGAMLRSVYKALRGDILQSDDVLDRNTIRTILRKRGIVLGDGTYFFRPNTPIVLLILFSNTLHLIKL